jgi:hypothetical protein
VSAAPLTDVARRSVARAQGTVLGRWWVAVLVVALGARLVSALVFVLVARHQDANLWTAADPSYPDYTSLMWDSSWYRRIAEHGYPPTLPLGSDGRVQQNAWAFFPLYPAMVRAAMQVTGGTWVVVAPLVAVLLGLLAMLVVHQVVAEAVRRTDLPERVRRHAPLLTVALLSTSASAPVLQVAYTESAALLGVATTLWAVQRRRYAPAALAIVAVGMTRAVALPLAVVVVAHGISRLRSGRAFPVARRLAVAGLALLGVVAGFAWPTAVAFLTGVPGAYELTQGAWRARGAVVPLLPWVDIARWALHGWAVPALGGLAALAVAGLSARSVRALGPVMHAWLAGYVVYLVAVIEPGTSLLRFAILAFPAWAALAVKVLNGRRAWVWSSVLVLAGLAGQVAWIGLIWRLVPPSGWPP